MTITVAAVAITTRGGGEGNKKPTAARDENACEKHGAPLLFLCPLRQAMPSKQQPKIVQYALLGLQRGNESKTTDDANIPRTPAALDTAGVRGMFKPGSNSFRSASMFFRVNLRGISARETLGCLESDCHRLFPCHPILLVHLTVRPLPVSFVQALSSPILKQKIHP